MNARFSRICRLGLVLLAVVGGGVWLVSHFAFRTTAYEKAEHAANHREFSRARELLELHLKEYPEDADALLLAARTARRDGDPAAARQYLVRLERTGGRAREVGLEAELIQLQQGNSKLGTALLARCRAEPDHEDSAIILEAVISTTLDVLVPPYAPHEPVTSSESGNAALRDARGAIDLWFTRSLLDPDRVQGHIWRARARELGGDHTGALEDLAQALAINPDHAYAGFLAAFFIQQENPAEAGRRLEALHAKHPSDFQIAMLLALMYRETGRLAEANRVLDDVERMKPKFTRVTFLRGIIALDQGRATEAEPLLRRVLEAEPNEPDYHEAFSRCMRQLGRSEEATRHHEAALRLERERRSPKP
jgi:tetratricopeptide (TPR) repeat protein